MSVRESVVLPQPDSPTSPSVSALASSKLTSSTACTRATSRVDEHSRLIGEVLLQVLHREQRRPVARSCGRGSVGRRQADLAIHQPQLAFAAGPQPAAVGVPGRLLCARARAAGPACTCRTRAGSAAGSGSPRGGRPATAASRRWPAAAPAARGPRARSSPAGPTCRGAAGRRRSRPACPPPRSARRTSPPPGRRCRPPRPGRGSRGSPPRRSRHAASRMRLQDLGLDRHVQGRGGLVGDQHAGIARQRQGDHHALAHAARELVRVVHRRGRARAGCPPAPAARSTARAPACSLTCSCARICSAIWSPILWTGFSDGHRVLEDHRDLRAAHGAQLRLGRRATSSMSP